MSRWEDLTLGLRLAVGGGRHSAIRLLLGTIGIGLAVAVLLVAASAGNIHENRQLRANASWGDYDPKPGVDPLFLQYQSSEFRGERIKLVYLRATGPNSPVPAGLTRVPSPGEAFVSPKLNELLASNPLLRPRLAADPAGTIDAEALENPNDMAAYIGADASFTGHPIYGFNASAPSEPLAPGVLVLLLIGIISLLTPVFIFIGTSSRIGGAERDRRLAALRLAGASAGQVRRIAVAETLVSTTIGLLAGAGLFLLFRGQAANLQVLRFGVFPGDLTPPWPLVVLIALVVPALTVLATLAAQRHTIVEPLGVVRQASPVRRRLWWRLLPVVVGIALLVPDVATGSELGRLMIMGGSLLLLIGIPALLPWLLERVVSRIRGGPPAFQLAIRRLQSDSGTPSRVVAGLCVVVAGAIALQSLLTGQAVFYDTLPESGPQSSAEPVLFSSNAGKSEELVAAVRAVPGATEVQSLRTLFVNEAGIRVGIADCATVKIVTEAPACTDGDVFAIANTRNRKFHNGQPVILTDTAKRDHRWVIPATPRMVEFTAGGLALDSGALLLATPAAMTGVDLSEAGTSGSVRSTATDPDFIEKVRNSIAPFGWRAQVTNGDGKLLSKQAKMFTDVRNLLFAGALFILMLAGVSLLVLAQEQVRERRRAISALSATGVPVRVVMRSLLWQNGIPLLLGIGVATGTGVVIAAMGTRLLGSSLVVDWTAVGLLAGAAMAVVLLVTASTWGTVRAAARLESLRTE